MRPRFLTVTTVIVCPESYEVNGQIEIPTFKHISGSSCKNGSKRGTYFSADIFEIHAYRISLQKVNGKCRL